MAGARTLAHPAPVLGRVLARPQMWVRDPAGLPVDKPAPVQSEAAGLRREVDLRRVNFKISSACLLDRNVRPAPAAVRHNSRRQAAVLPQTSCKTLVLVRVSCLLDRPAAIDLRTGR